MIAKDTGVMMSSDSSLVTPSQQIISSCSGALLTSFLTTPFDVVKVRLQRQQAIIKPCYIMDCRAALDSVCICTVSDIEAQIHHIDHNVKIPRFTGTLDAFIKLARTEGLKSWWQGLSPSLVMAVPMTVIYYTSYDQLKVKFGFRHSKRNIVAPLTAGVISRTLAVTCVCPIELIRTKLQSRTGHSIPQVLSVAKTVISQNGVLSLWRGLSPMLLRDVPFSIIFWLGYEELKWRFSYTFPVQYLSLMPFVAGSLSGGVAAIITTPLDVVKTHMQVEIGESTGSVRLGMGSVTMVMRNIVSKYGTVGLFAGLTPRIAKVAPACAIMIGSYEACKQFFATRNANK